MVRSKYESLWSELEALDLYETWFVSSERIQGSVQKIITALTRAYGRGKFSVMKLMNGFLFVRIL